MESDDHSNSPGFSTFPFVAGSGRSSILSRFGQMICERRKGNCCMNERMIQLYGSNVSQRSNYCKPAVAPARGTWIEIAVTITVRTEKPSPPARGAWIEIRHPAPAGKAYRVAPRTGAWIEILIPQSAFFRPSCHSPRMRG